MPLQDGIQQFLDGIDPKILARGKDYYRSGQVEGMEWDGHHMTAEVSGSDVEPYLVEISFTEDGAIADWSCDCPYDWGDVCKHTAAVLLLIQQETEELPPEKKKREKVSIQALVESAKKEQLAALVFEHCQEDKRFQSQVLSELESSGEQELSAIKELVKGSIRSNTYRGYIDEEGCDNICADLDDALDKARRRIKHGQYDRALDIAQFVLLTGVKLAGEADSSSGSLGWTIDAALETVELAAAGLAKSGGGRTEWVKKLLKTVQDPVFDGWDHWRYDLLQRVAVLADEQNEGEFYAVLDRLSDRLWEGFKDLPRYGYGKEDKITRYHVLCSVHGPGAAKAYLEQNLDVDEFRLILVRENMAEKDYANAERLCREKVDKEQPERWQRPSQWQYLLYEIYQDWGQREKQIKRARRLALLGDRDFYQTAKELLTEAGRWQEEYPGFLAELKAIRPVYEYMEILKLENETALLMEQVRLYPETVFQYGGILAPQYGKEVFSLCASAIRENVKQASDRKAYQRVCDLIQSLAEFGGAKEAKILIGELRQFYPRRPALLDELVRVERAITKKRAGHIS